MSDKGRQHDDDLPREDDRLKDDDGGAGGVPWPPDPNPDPDKDHPLDPPPFDMPARSVDLEGEDEGEQKW